MSDEQKAWTVAQISPSEQVPSLVMNSMNRSNILTPAELRYFKLDIPGLRWKCVFDSTTDRMGRFMDAASMALELFHRKIIVLRISTRLSIAIYIPRKIEKYEEALVDDTVRVFCFPHSHGDETSHRRALPTKVDYRFYFDNNGFQLFEKQRSNTWIFFRKPGSDDAAYRNIENQGDKRRARHATIEMGLNSDFVASVALVKFSAGLARQIGRVNRDPVSGAEIYLISNRDIRSLQVLDQWLETIDTEETLPLFSSAEREYTVPSIKGLDWTKVPNHIGLVARDAQFSSFQALEDDKSMNEVFEWLLLHNQKTTLRKAFEYLLSSFAEGEFNLRTSTLSSMIDFLHRAPFLVITFAGLGSWDVLPKPMKIILNDRSIALLKALALVSVEVQNLVVEPFRRILSQVSYMSLGAFGDLVETITLVVRSLETALDLLLGSLEWESSRLLVARPRVAQCFVKNCIGIAVDHIEEKLESHSNHEDVLHLKQDHTTGLLRAQVRIDSHSSLSANDHLQLTASQLPTNSLETRPYSMDALVEKAESGMISIRSIHSIPSFLEDCSWKVNNCGSFVTTKTMFAALNNVILEPDYICPIFERMMAVGPVIEMSPNAAPSLDARELNDSQKSAVAAAIQGPLTCVWGPPGTGKTHTIAVILELLLSSDPARRILVTAPTHNAVDNVMRKFIYNMQGVSNTFALRVSTEVRKILLSVLLKIILTRYRFAKLHKICDSILATP